MCATEFVTSYFVIVQGRMSTVNNYCHTSTSIAVMSATASDSEEYGANDEPQAAICSVIRMKSILLELLHSNVKNKPLISSNCRNPL